MMVGPPQWNMSFFGLESATKNVRILLVTGILREFFVRILKYIIGTS